MHTFSFVLEPDSDPEFTAGAFVDVDSKKTRKPRTGARRPLRRARRTGRGDNWDSTIASAQKTHESYRTLDLPLILPQERNEAIKAHRRIHFWKFSVGIRY